MLTGQGRGKDFLLLEQAAPPFLSLSSLPLPSRFPSLPIPSFRSRPLLLLFPTLHSLPFTCKSPMSKTITTTSLRQGSETVVCKMRLQVKNALLHTLCFVQPSYYCTPWLGQIVMHRHTGHERDAICHIEPVHERSGLLQFIVTKRYNVGFTSAFFVSCNIK